MISFEDVRRCSFCGKTFPWNVGRDKLQTHIDKHPRIEDGTPVWVYGIGRNLSEGWMQVEFDMGNGKFYRKAFPTDIVDVEDD